MASSVEINFTGITAVVPKSLADREGAEEAVEALLRAAVLHHNRSVRAVRAKRIPEALQAIRSAVRFCPYCMEFVDFGLALSIQHGDFEFANRLLTWAGEAQIDGEIPRGYDDALERSVSDWNRFLNDTSALRKKYQSPDSSTSYRELLLLADRVGEDSMSSLSEQERLCLDGYGVSYEENEQAPSRSSNQQTPSWQRQAGIAGVTGLLGLALGLGIYDPYISDGSDTPASRVNPLTTEIDSLRNRSVKTDSLLQRIERANRLLARGDPLGAHEVLGTRVDTSNMRGTAAVKKSVRGAVDRRLYASAVRAWGEEDFGEVVDLLTKIRSDTPGPKRERLYMLGVSANQIDKPEIAVESLQGLMEIGDLSEQYPHYEAQAAHILVQRLSEPEAQRYASLIADKYSDTLYYNSTVRSYL